MANIGERIKSEREKLGLNQTELASKIGAGSATVISRYENNQREPDITVLVKLCDVFDCDPGWLLTGHKDMAVEKQIVQETQAAYGADAITEKIVLLLKDMPEEARLEILRSVEEKKLLRELLEERKRLKDTG